MIEAGGRPADSREARSGPEPPGQGALSGEEAEARRLRGAIFDLDGVITDTARLHANAWKELIDPYLEERAGRTGESHAPFDPVVDYRRYVDGKPRYQGLRSFLEARGVVLDFGDPDDPPGHETVCGLANRKDAIFHRVLEREGVDVIPGTIELVRELRERGVRTAVASSSRNCRRIVERAGVADLFEARVDGETLRELGLAGKPNPDMFVEAARRLDVDPGDAVVFEDAVSGVEAGRRGDFGLVVGVAVDPDARSALRRAGADLLVEVVAMEGLSADLLETWFRNRKHRRPSALGRWEELRAEIGERRPVVFLDYDGTLTPIVDRPERAVLSDEMRGVVRRLAERLPTTIVSGRGREDVARLVGLGQVNYAGSHGFDISGPDSDPEGGEGEPAVHGVDTIRHEVAAELEPVVEEATARLEEELSEVEGAIVEPKRFTVAVHYRLVPEEHRRKVEEAVDRVVERHQELRKAGGKMVFEIRPRMDWDKGRAVLWLLEALELDGAGDVPIYLGDDTTDEDAFRALADRGIGILVASAPRPTAARYWLQDTGEVAHVLSLLAEV